MRRANDSGGKLRSFCYRSFCKQAITLIVTKSILRHCRVEHFECNEDVSLFDSGLDLLPCLCWQIR